MEEPESDSDRGTDVNELTEGDWGIEEVDIESQPQDGTDESYTSVYPDSEETLPESPYVGWDEPFEIAIDDVNPGEEENVEKVAAGGRTTKLSLGGISRRVLEHNETTRQQPLKMKNSPKQNPGNDPLSDKKQGKIIEKIEPPTKKVGFTDIAKLAKQEFWTTADEYRDIDPESYVIFSMRDVALYLIFLTLTATIAFGSLAYAYNYYANILSELLTNSKFETEIGGPKTFRNIHRIQDIWSFINSILLAVLYPSASGTTREDRFTKFEGITVLQQNIVVGAPRIRQVRVKSGTCSSAPMFNNFYISCYDYYDDDNKDENTFGKGSKAFMYTPPSDGENSQYSGVVSSYGEGGFMTNFSTDFEFNKAFFKELEDNVWIQIGSRAVFVDFTLYTPNANLFCVVKLVFEIIPAGGVVANSNIYSLKLLRYVTKWDYFIAGCELIFICFAIYYSYEEIRQIIRMKEAYLDNWWNILDFTIVLGSWAVIVIGLIRQLAVFTTMRSKVMKIHTQEHASFEYLTRLQNLYDASASILTFVVWLKIVKFSSLSRSVSTIISTFGRVRLELAALSFMTVAVVMGFALLGNALFGSHVLQFRSVADAFFTLIGLFVGGLYFYDECRYAAPLSSQIYFIMYIFCVLVIFLSAFVAVIVFGFLIAVNDIDDVRDRVYLGDVCLELWLKTLTTFGCRKFAAKLRTKQLAKLHMRDYDALTYIIRRHGYRGLDLELLLKNHNVKPEQRLNLTVMSDVYNDLTTRNQLHVEVEEHDKIMDHIDKINKTIEFLDLTLADIVGKVDILANKLLAGKK